MAGTIGTVVTMTPNQLVAYNLRRARLLRGWSQKEAIERLEPFGVRWSTASYSVAECSVHRLDRIRRFSADEIVAFARAFDKPVEWFFQDPVEFVLSAERLEDWRDCAAADETEVLRIPQELVDHIDGLQALLDKEVRVSLAGMELRETIARALADEIQMPARHRQLFGPAAMEYDLITGWEPEEDAHGNT